MGEPESAESDDTSPIVMGIRARMPSLHPACVKVATTVLELGERLDHTTATEVAEQSGAALSTVVRTCQLLGFKGYQDLKISLARERRPATPAELQHDVVPGDSPGAILRKVGAASRAAIDHGLRHVDTVAFDRAVKALDQARQVLVLGVGTSAPLAQDASYRLDWLGLSTFAPTDVHVQHVRASALTTSDVALVVSHTGSTRETVGHARAAHECGATVIGLTSYPRSPLVEVCDLVLLAPSRETGYRVEALASRLAHLMVIDALWVALAVVRGPSALAHARAVADIISEHRF